MVKSKNKVKHIPVSFAGANTGSGFVSFYDSIFCEEKLAGLYIIKGGSGTGKSTFMKRLGEYAVKKGYSCEHYLCGSDENSLDGIIISTKKGAKVGVIDGTPPHPREFRSPGAAGDILNFGAFWDSTALRQMRKEIDNIVREKTACFETTYRYLGAAKKINKHITSLAEETYLKDKAALAAERIVQSVGVFGTDTYRQLNGFTMNGRVQLSPCKDGLREFVVSGNEDIARLFLDDVMNYIISNGISAEISRSPLDLRQVEGILFPESRVWLHIGEKTGDEEKVINTGRFIDKEKAAACRQRMRFGKKCRESLIEGAFESLKSAKEYHFGLEEIYKEYMDFDALNSQSEIWYSEILSRLD